MRPRILGRALAHMNELRRELGSKKLIHGSTKSRTTARKAAQLSGTEYGPETWAAGSR